MNCPAPINVENTAKTDALIDGSLLLIMTREWFNARPAPNSMPSYQKTSHTARYCVIHLRYFMRCFPRTLRINRTPMRRSIACCYWSWQGGDLLTSYWLIAVIDHDKGVNCSMKGPLRRALQIIKSTVRHMFTSSQDSFWTLRYISPLFHELFLTNAWSTANDDAQIDGLLLLIKPSNTPSYWKYATCINRKWRLFLNNGCYRVQ